MKQRSSRCRGFTLVELLVVIGIIALLISILLPSLNKARLQAKRVTDLSNIRQMAIVCVTYASENRGDWPLGDRGGPNLNVEPVSNDDLSWINAFTFDYFLQASCDRATAVNWLSTTAPYPNGKALDAAQQKRFCCTSIADSAYTAQQLNYVGLANVGVTTWRYYIQQTDPAGAGYNETYMGYIYWGRRANSLQGPVYDQTGTAVTPATTFTYPLKQGQRSFSRTLLSCPAYANNGGGDYAQFTHCYSSDSFIQGGNFVSNGPGNGKTGTSAAMNGICCAYVDGSASFVPRKQLWSVFEGGFAWVYFDKGN
jgi:prepilin-type N-terminal cleavage/methylation domain-containing protein